MLYSALTGGFYHPQIHGDSIPQDAVEIDAARHAELIAGQGLGQIISAGQDGAPVLSNPPPPSLKQIKDLSLARMGAWIDGFLDQFTAGVPAAELASWPVKADRARAHLAGTPQPMIVAEAAITGEDAGVLAQKIVAKSGAYEAIIARVTGLRRATEGAIAQATTPEAVKTALDTAHAQAVAMAAQMGISAPA